jgi:hypothetical protein
MSTYNWARRSRSHRIASCRSSSRYASHGTAVAMAASPASTSATTVVEGMARSYAPPATDAGPPGGVTFGTWATRRARRISPSSPSSARSATRCTNGASSGRGRCTAPGRTAGTRTIASPGRCGTTRRRSRARGLKLLDSRSHAHPQAVQRPCGVWSVPRSAASGMDVPPGLPDAAQGAMHRTAATSRPGTRPGCCRTPPAPGGPSSARARPECPSHRGSPGCWARR